GCARQARQQVVPSGTGGEGTRTGPHTKETFSVECAKGLHGATGVGSPYGRTQPDMEGLETRITGFRELRSPIRRSLHPRTSQPQARRRGPRGGRGGGRRRGTGGERVRGPGRWITPLPW